MPSRETRWWRHHQEQKGRHEQDKALKKIRREMKQGKKGKKSRRKNWQAGDEANLPEEERMLPVGEQDRRRDLQAERLQALAEDETTSYQQGVVIGVGGGLCHVQVADTVLVCSVRRSLQPKEYINVVAVGDRVLVDETGPEQGVIEAVLPRRTALIRPDVGHAHRKQVLVANVDQLLIVASWRNPQLWPELIDRYLIAAARNELSPLICVNKIDLADDPADYHTAMRPYRELGYSVLFASTVTGEGLDLVRDVLRGKVTALAGLSGVGKSSLVRAVQPNLNLRIGAVNDETGQGRHTTSQATWHELDLGGVVVDTPGIREFGLAGLAPVDLAHFYPEMANRLYACRFNNCTHRHEPGCAIKAAVEAGEIAPLRYDNYLKIFDSLEAG